MPDGAASVKRCGTCDYGLRPAALYCEACGAAVTAPVITTAGAPAPVQAGVATPARAGSETASSPSEPLQPVIVTGQAPLASSPEAAPFRSAAESAYLLEDPAVSVGLPTAPGVPDVPPSHRESRTVVWPGRRAVARRRLTGRVIRDRSRLNVIAMGMVVLLVGGVVGWLVVPHGAPAASEASTAVPVPAGIVQLPGWSTTPAWTALATGVVVSPDGGMTATSTGDTVTILSGDGSAVSSTEVPELTGLLPARVDGKAAVVAQSPTALVEWLPGASAPVEVPIPAGSRLFARDLTLLIIPGDGSAVSVLTSAGLATYVSPRPGAASLAVTADGGMQWASARGEVVTASPVGTVTATVPLAAPVPGSTISRWLAGGQAVLVEWQAPDGHQVVATHDPATGAVLSTGDSASSPLVLAQDGATAMLGPVLIDLATGVMSTPDLGFQASKGLGSEFYGATGPTPAVLANGTVTTAAAPPTVTPAGVTTDGALIASTPAGVAAYSPVTTK